MRTLLFLLISTVVFGQVEPGKWFFGLGVNFVDYYTQEVTTSSGIDATVPSNDFTASEYFQLGKSEIGFPRISATYMWKENIALDASFSLNNITKLDGVSFSNSDQERFFASLDLNAEYRFLNNSSLVQLYPILGAGITHSIGVENIGAALNLGFGLDIWTRGNLGIYAKTMYRYTAAINIYSHNYHAIGLNYRLDSYGRTSGRGRGCMVNKYHF